MKFNLDKFKNMDKSMLGDALFVGAIFAEIIVLKKLLKKFESTNEESSEELDEFTKERLVKQLNTLQGKKRKEFIDSIIQDGTFYKCNQETIDRIDIFVLQEVLEAHNENVRKMERNRRL